MNDAFIAVHVHLHRHISREKEWRQLNRLTNNAEWVHDSCHDEVSECQTDEEDRLRFVQVVVQQNCSQYCNVPNAAQN